MNKNDDLLKQLDNPFHQETELNGTRHKAAQAIRELETVLENADMLLEEIDMAAKITELQEVVDRLASSLALYIPYDNRLAVPDRNELNARIEYAKLHSTRCVDR
ncbi:hypothetical protein KAR91_71315 [Candidatus Pacearchaeota archaeon]|nr:hypothetical protein [Candidatus Pacearchaeota archaeon]